MKRVRIVTMAASMMFQKLWAQIQKVNDFICLYSCRPNSRTHKVVTNSAKELNSRGVLESNKTVLVKKTSKTRHETMSQ